MITLTVNAKEQVNEILMDEQAPYIRAFISGGGCSGFNYGFKIENQMEEDDILVEENFIVDALSMQHFLGATIDYTSDKLKGSQFVIKNPNAKTTCGCGSSFSV
jgi:iron-sulfur cluster insertion protein